MKMYHGTDSEIVSLRAGSFVTRSVKDAWKFGYRKAVLNKRRSVFIYIAEVNKTIVRADTTRDRAFVLLTPVAVNLFKTSPTWDAPFKLKAFSFAGSGGGAGQRI